MLCELFSAREDILKFENCMYAQSTNTQNNFFVELYIVYTFSVLVLPLPFFTYKISLLFLFDLKIPTYLQYQRIQTWMYIVHCVLYYTFSYTVQCTVLSLLIVIFLSLQYFQFKSNFFQVLFDLRTLLILYSILSSLP